MSIREVVLTALLSTAIAGTAIAATQHDHDAAAPTSSAQQMPGMDHQKMTADRQKMMADMQAEQAKLDDLVAQMNAATGAGKIDRIVAVVNEMAAMHKRMNTMMQGGMMQGGMPMHPQTP